LQIYAACGGSGVFLRQMVSKARQMELAHSNNIKKKIERILKIKNN
jgi:hypothetical protein